MAESLALSQVYTNRLKHILQFQSIRDMMSF